MRISQLGQFDVRCKNMKFWEKVKRHIIPPSIPETEYGMTEANFLIKSLEASPDGSTLQLDMFEPEEWATRLKTWSFRKNVKQLEADYYTIDKAFTAEVKSILSEKPDSLNAIPHITIVTKEGEAFLLSNDNFTLVTVSESLKRKLKQK